MPSSCLAALAGTAGVAGPPAKDRASLAGVITMRSPSLPNSLATIAPDRSRVK